MLNLRLGVSPNGRCLFPKRRRFLPPRLYLAHNVALSLEGGRGIGAERTSLELMVPNPDEVLAERKKWLRPTSLLNQVIMYSGKTSVLSTRTFIKLSELPVDSNR